MEHQFQENSPNFPFLQVLNVISAFYFLGLGGGKANDEQNS